MDELDKILTETIVSLADEMKREVETPGLIRVPIKGRIAKIRKAIDAHYEAKIVEARIDEPEERTEINKILHNKIFACLMGNMTIPQARVQATTMMYTINSHLSKYWSPKQAYCRKQQLHGRQLFLCDRDIRHEGECSWELVDKIKQLETRLIELKKEKH